MFLILRIINENWKYCNCKKQIENISDLILWEVR
jgi:hypothetical protein